MSKGYTSDLVIKVWDDENGDYIQVGPDGDGLDLVELQYINSVGHRNRFPPIPKEWAVEVAKAILKLSENG